MDLAPGWRGFIVAARFVTLLLSEADVEPLLDLERAIDEIIIFKESGGGFGDVAFANSIYAQAREKGLGQEWSSLRRLE